MLPQLVWKCLACLNLITEICDDLMILSLLYLQTGTALYAARYPWTAAPRLSWAHCEAAQLPQAARGEWGSPKGKEDACYFGHVALVKRGRSRLCFFDQLEVFIQWYCNVNHRKVPGTNDYNHNSYRSTGLCIVIWGLLTISCLLLGPFHGFFRSP